MEGLVWIEVGHKKLVETFLRCHKEQHKLEMSSDIVQSVSR